MKKSFKLIAAALAAITSMSCTSATAFADKLKTIDGVTYRYSDSGEQVGKYTAWAKTSKGRRYYKNGVMLKKTWLKTKAGKYYYIGKDGYVSTGFVKVTRDKSKGKYSYFDNNGVWDGNYYAENNIYTIKRNKNSGNEFSSNAEYFEINGQKFWKYENFTLLSTDGVTDPLDTVNNALSYINTFVYKKEDVIKLLDNAQKTGVDSNGSPVFKLSEQVYILGKVQPDQVEQMNKMDKNELSGYEDRLFYVYLSEDIHPSFVQDINPGTDYLQLFKIDGRNYVIDVETGGYLAYLNKSGKLSDENGESLPGSFGKFDINTCKLLGRLEKYGDGNVFINAEGYLLPDKSILVMTKIEDNCYDVFLLKVVD